MSVETACKYHLCVVYTYMPDVTHWLGCIRVLTGCALYSLYMSKQVTKFEMLLLIKRFFLRI